MLHIDLSPFLRTNAARIPNSLRQPDFLITDCDRHHDVISRCCCW